MKKKVVSLMLTSAMVLSMAGCGTSSSGGAASTSGESSDETAEASASISDGDTAQASEASTEAAYSNFPAKDLGGRTIKIGIWWDEFWDSNYQTLDDIDKAGGTYDNADTMQMKLDAVRAVEKKWNCKIEWVNLGWDGIIESINTSVTAGTPDCDIYLSDLQFGLAPVANGYAEKLSELCPDGDVNNDQKVFTKNDYLGYDDYFFSTSTTIPSGAMYMAYNAQMIDDLGLEKPEDLAAEGKWTWDKFEEYAKKCTQDSDGDGTPDVYGFGTAWTLAVQGFEASNNAQLCAGTEEGLSDPATSETFDFLQKLYVTDKVARPINDDDWNDNLLAFSSGKAAFCFAQPWILVQELSNHDFDVRICPAPTGPSGDGSMSPVNLTNNYFIPKGVEDATSVYEVFEEMNNWFLGDTELRDDPMWFESAFVDEDQVALATEIGLKANNDIWNTVDTQGAVNSVFYGACVRNDSTVAQAIESNKQVLQDELDALLGASDSDVSASK